MDRVQTAERPLGRRLLLGFVLGMLVLLLLVDGFTTKTVGASSTPAGATGLSALRGLQPILRAGPGRAAAPAGSCRRRPRPATRSP
jgi:hypothetical protein